MPALAFSLDMFEKTHQSYGVNEVLLASVLGAVVFSLFAAQPLVIVGVTGESGVEMCRFNQIECLWLMAFYSIRSDHGV